MDPHEPSQRHSSGVTGKEVPQDSSVHAATDHENFEDHEFIPGVGFGIKDGGFSSKSRSRRYNEAKKIDKFSSEKWLISEDEILAMAAEVQKRRAMDKVTEARNAGWSHGKPTHPGFDTVDPSQDPENVVHRGQNDRFEIDTSESRISIGVTSSTGSWLNGSTIKQSRFVRMEIHGPDGRTLVRVNCSFEQFAAALFSNMQTPCTLESYWSINDDNVLLTERVKPPASITDRMKQRLANNLDEVDERLNDVIKQLTEAAESGKAIGKAKAKELARELAICHEHRRENIPFTVEQAAEETGKILEAAAIHLATKYRTEPDAIVGITALKAIEAPNDP